MDLALGPKCIVVITGNGPSLNSYHKVKISLCPFTFGHANKRILAFLYGNLSRLWLGCPILSIAVGKHNKNIQLPPITSV